MSNVYEHILYSNVSDTEVMKEFAGFLSGKFIMEMTTSHTSSTEPFEALSVEKLLEMTQEVLDMIEKQGWIQNAYEENNHVCLMGAARRVDNLKSLAWSREVLAFLQREKSFGGVAVERWNDEEGRTFEEVIGMLRDFMHEVKGRS